MADPKRDLEKFQQEIDEAQAKVRRVSEGGSSVIKKPANLDVVLVVACGLGVIAAGVHFVGQMTDQHRFALMTGMGALELAWLQASLSGQTAKNPEPFAHTSKIRLSWAWSC